MIFGFVGGRTNCIANYHTDLKARTNVWEFPVTPPSEFCKDELGVVINPAQKPLSLIRCLISRHSNEGNTILDLCSGSGTTALAAASLKRNCVSVETDEEQTRYMQCRLEMANFDAEIFNKCPDPFYNYSTQIFDDENKDYGNMCSFCNIQREPKLLTSCPICFRRYCHNCIKQSAVNCECGHAFNSDNNLEIDQEVDQTS